MDFFDQLQELNKPTVHKTATGKIAHPSDVPTINVQIKSQMPGDCMPAPIETSTAWLETVRRRRASYTTQPAD